MYLHQKEAVSFPCMLDSNTIKKMKLMSLGDI